MRNRIIFTIVTLLILVGVGAAYFYFSDMGLIPDSWVAPLGATEGVLAILLTVGQYLVPLPSSDAKLSASSTENSYIQGVFIKSIEDRLIAGNAAVVVYEKRRNIGEDVSLGYGSGNKASIVERIVNGHPLVAAVLSNVKPGSYYMRGPDGSNKHIELKPGDIYEIDWSQNRNKSEKSESYEDGKKRKKIQKRRSIDLRANALLVGSGGLSLTIQVYFQTPYHLDVVGILLAGLGIVNLLFSFFLDWFDWRKAGYLRLSVFLIGAGGGIYLAQRYIQTPYHLDIVGIIIVGLGSASLLSTLLFGWFDWYREGGGVVVCGIELGVALIIVHRDLMIPYLDIAGYILSGLLTVGCIIALIVAVVEEYA